MKQFQIILFSLLIVYINTACQTRTLKQFEQIKQGMEKDQILEIMGSPQKTSRVNSTDKWNYIFYDQENKYNKEIHFVEGISTYIGDPILPPITAEKQDQINEDSNKNLEQILAQQKLEKENKSIEQYEKSIKNNNEILYVPQFVPIE